VAGSPTRELSSSSMARGMVNGSWHQRYASSHSGLPSLLARICPGVQLQRARRPVVLGELQVVLPPSRPARLHN